MDHFRTQSRNSVRAATDLIRRVVVALFVCVLATSAQAAGAEPEVLRVFVFAGQSNMVGSDSRASDIRLYPPFAGLDQPQEGVRFSYCIGREDKRQSDGWTQLAPVDGIVGPELSFARRVTQELRAPIAIIKVAAGGTHLGGDWNPDEPSGFKLYPLALDRVRTALADLGKNGIAYRLEGFVWHQGENDMFEQRYREAYAKNLARFIACWRRDLATPELKFFLGELCTKTIWGMDHRTEMEAIVQCQKEVAAADPLVEFVPTSHIGIEIGGGAGLHYHYGTLGQLEHGVCHAESYLRTLGLLQDAPRPLEPWPYKKGDKVKLFVLAGHRNMEGECAFVQELESLPGGADLAKPDARIAYRYDLGGGTRLSRGWQALAPAGSFDTFGPELSFAATLARQTSERIAIAKFTHSGSQIVDWTPAGSEAPARNLYPRFLDFVQSALRELEARGQSVELAGIVYHLGENDMAFAPYRRKAVAHLGALVAQLRKDLGQPTLRWFVSQQPPAEEKGLERFDVVADLQQLAATDPNLVIVPAFDLPGRERRLVITTSGLVALGERLAQSVLERGVLAKVLSKQDARK